MVGGLQIPGVVQPFLFTSFTDSQGGSDEWEPNQGRGEQKQIQ